MWNPTGDVMNQSHKLFADKRCPYCFTHLKLNETECVGCHKKVGEVDKHGLARKPIRYKAYFAFFLWGVVVLAYIWVFRNYGHYFNIMK